MSTECFSMSELEWWVSDDHLEAAQIACYFGDVIIIIIALKSFKILHDSFGFIMYLIIFIVRQQNSIIFIT